MRRRRKTLPERSFRKLKMPSLRTRMQAKLKHSKLPLTPRRRHSKPNRLLSRPRKMLPTKSRPREKRKPKRRRPLKPQRLLLKDKAERMLWTPKIQT